MKNQKRPPIFRDLIEVLAGFAVFGILLAAFLFTVKTCAKEVLDVAGRMAAAERGDASESHEEAVLEAERYMAGSTTGVGRVSKALWVYTEGDGPAPEWYDPDEPMAVEWEDPNTRQSDSNAIQRTDMGCSDPWFDSPIYGWDGRIITQSELDLFARCFMREFWGTSLPCCEAGCDAMLNLWSTGLYGDTLFECLSAQNEQGGYIYSVYPTIWEGYYNPDGLAWCKEFVLERFLNGPEWGCVYFRLGWYHSTDWCKPLYAIDNVFFSGEKDG